ncbi:MAG TPA: hypothetical protein DHV28_13620 [Ignavibacteriales bacterium]|nr:hypothetical protein [Ignavibacteriales bacterium]
MDLSWILEIRDYEKHFAIVLKDYDDLFSLNEIINKNSGSAGFVKVFEHFLKTSIRFPEKPLNGLKKIYVFQNSQKPVAKIAREISVDEATVYSWLREFNGKQKSKTNRNDLIDDLLN